MAWCDPDDEPTGDDLGLQLEDPPLDHVPVPANANRIENIPRDIYELLRRGVPYDVVQELIQRTCSLNLIYTDDQLQALLVMYLEQNPALNSRMWCWHVPSTIEVKRTR